MIPTEGFESAVLEELKPVAKRAGGVAHLPTRLNRTSGSCSLAVAETALLYNMRPIISRNQMSRGLSQSKHAKQFFIIQNYFSPVYKLS